MGYGLDAPNFESQPQENFSSADTSKPILGLT
jgi:hypothetical protein